MALFYKFVPQAMDQEVQYGNNQAVKYGNYFISVKILTGLGLYKHKNSSPMEHYLFSVLNSIFHLIIFHIITFLMF